jgi:hypothetical protein
MATVTPNFNFPVPQSTDLVKDGATAIAALGTSVDTQFVDLKGGTTGQVLSKASNTDLDYSWVTTDDANAIQNAIVDAKGDLIAATAADTPARLAVGTNGQSLVADSTAATGLKWQSDTVNTVIDAKGDLLAGTAADTLSRIAVGTNFGFLQADSAEATGLLWNNAAWTTYTPTITATSGTFTTVSATGRYTRVGKLCVTQFAVTITTNGTAAGQIVITAPFGAGGGGTIYQGTTRESNATGFLGSCAISSGGGASFYVSAYDNSYMGGSGRLISGSISYEVA